MRGIEMRKCPDLTCTDLSCPHNGAHKLRDHCDHKMLNLKLCPVCIECDDILVDIEENVSNDFLSRLVFFLFIVGSPCALYLILWFLFVR